MVSAETTRPIPSTNRGFLTVASFRLICKAAPRCLSVRTISSPALQSSSAEGLTRSITLRPPWRKGGHRGAPRQNDGVTDLAAAAQFIAGHARLLERRRFGLFEGDGSPERVVAALTAYQNADGGIGHLEPDLRTPASQPACVLYALEVLHEAGVTGSTLATGALDWLSTVTSPDGGVPFLLASARGWPHAPWWVPEDDPPAALLMTAAITARPSRPPRIAPPSLRIDL